MVTFLTFEEAKIIGGIVPNLIAFGLFLGAIGYFALTEKMDKMFGWKTKNKAKSIKLILKRDRRGTIGVFPLKKTGWETCL